MMHTTLCCLPGTGPAIASNMSVLTRGRGLAAGRFLKVALLFRACRTLSAAVVAKPANEGAVLSGLAAAAGAGRQQRVLLRSTHRQQDNKTYGECGWYTIVVSILSYVNGLLPDIAARLRCPWYTQTQTETCRCSGANTGAVFRMLCKLAAWQSCVCWCQSAADWGVMSAQ
jgi:hypothetical protein